MGSTVSSSHREDLGKLVLRLAVGILLLLHGVAKMKNGIAWMAGPLGALGLPAFVGYGVFVGEVAAPLFAIAGKYTRVAGLVMAFNMLMAVVVARRTDVLALNRGGGWAIEVEMLFLAGGVLMALFGAGRYSLSRGAGRWD